MSSLLSQPPEEPEGLQKVLRDPQKNPIEALCSFIPAAMVKRRSAVGQSQRQRITSSYIYYYQQQQNNLLNQQQMDDISAAAADSRRHHQRSQTLMAAHANIVGHSNDSHSALPYMTFYGSFV